MRKVRINVKVLPSVLEEDFQLPIYLALEAEPSRNCYPDDLICETILYLIEEGYTMSKYALEKDALQLWINPNHLLIDLEPL